MKKTTLALLLLVFVGCHREEAAAVKAVLTKGDGNVEAGKAENEKYGCNACHIIPRIEGQRGMAGPSLEHLKSRPLLSGKLPNNPAIVTKWMQNPPAMDPQSAMPNLGVTPDDARDITAYLFAQP